MGKFHRPLLHLKNGWERKAPSAGEIEAFKSFLSRLVGIEKYIAIEIAHQEASLKVRVESKDMIAFECEASLTFHLADEDPAYREDDDNILYELEVAGTGLYNDSLNWDIELYEGYPLLGHRHPCLFHELCSHAGIGHRDLMRIGMIWVDVNLTLQQRFDP